jgi:hypothetical protein
VLEIKQYSSTAPSLRPSLTTTNSSTSQSTISKPCPSNPTSIDHSKQQEANIHNNKNPFTMNSYSPFLGASSSTLTLSDPRIADLHSFASQFDKMIEPRLDRQRYVPSGDKVEELAKIALGAKVERALARRLTGQDANLPAGAAAASASLSSAGRSMVDEKGVEVV